MAAVRSTFRAQCAVSLRHRPNATLSEVEGLQFKAKTTIRLLDHEQGTVDPSSCIRLVGGMIDASLLIGLSLACIRGDWIGPRNALHAWREPLTRRYE